MEKYKWLEKIKYTELTGPFVIENDKQYYEEIKNKLDFLVGELERCGAQSEIIEVAEKYSKNLIEALDKYYQGDLIEAHQLIFELINGFSEEEIGVISNIKNSIAFSDSIFNSQNTDKEVQFFRARLSDSVIDFSAKEMLHIPFEKRELVKSERFSIPGLPCLYLENSSYVCWIEMGRPADHMFNVAPIVLDDTQKILNLTVSITDINEMLTLEDSEKTEKIDARFIDMFKAMILNIATSYRVLQENRNFKSEYILPQMIMLACLKNGLDGITYFSKQTGNEIFSHVVGVNLVLFGKYDGEYEGVSKICRNIEIGDSFNFSMFKQLLFSLKYKEYPLKIGDSMLTKNIGTFKRQFPYKETQFYEFDKYIFANWNNRKSGK